MMDFVLVHCATDAKCGVKRIRDVQRTSAVRNVITLRCAPLCITQSRVAHLEGSTTSVQRSMFPWKVIILMMLLFNCIVTATPRRDHNRKPHGKGKGRPGPWVHNYYGFTKDDIDT
ncbi:hypothetical protein GCK32_015134 [Trichostrongylus colubriformis]|uniref:Uncharacterized protein n=1 Tax=Trichostrongylus colubriformis TaxID=6319 RepID=A0AAN8IF62_TRICO